MPVSLDGLLQGSVADSLSLRAMPDDPREITRVTLVEDIASAEALKPGAIGVLTRQSASLAGGYQLDVLVRRAAEHEVSALLLRRSTRRSPTAEALAVRGRVALLDIDDARDPAEVVDLLSATVAGEARTRLRRIADSVRGEQPEDLDPTAVVAHYVRTTGIQMSYDSAARSGSPVVVDGMPRGTIVTVDDSDAAVVAGRLAAAMLSETLTRQEDAVLLPMRTTSAALVQLLLCSQTHLAQVTLRAQESGFRAEDWHTAARLTVDAPNGDTEGRGSTIPNFEDEALSFLAQQQHDPRAAWSVARPDNSIVLMRTTRTNPGPTSSRQLESALEPLVSFLTSQHPHIHFRIGIATAHHGSSGLRVSAEESRTALAAARLGDDPVSIAKFDALGTRRMMAEWLATDTARETVNDLLAPLDALGPVKAEIAVQTLHAYLDERGSWQRAAARLHVHRNAVVYRLGQIRQVLHLDTDDPEQWFALQLACRARLMTSGQL